MIEAIGAYFQRTSRIGLNVSLNVEVIFLLDVVPLIFLNISKCIWVWIMENMFY